MAILEALTVTVGTAIAKATLKFWLKDHDALADVSADLVDLIRGRFTEYRARNAAERQFRRIAEKAAEHLLAIATVEFRTIDESGFEAVSREVASSINKIQVDATSLAKVNIDPKPLGDRIRRQANLKAFSQSECDLFERILDESSQLIVDFASNLPGFTERTLGEVLQRESVIIERVDHVLTEIERLRESAIFTDVTSAQARFEQAYRRQVARKLDEIELYGASELISSTTSRQHNLTLAYISLSVLQKTSAPSHTNPAGAVALTEAAGLTAGMPQAAGRALLATRSTRVESALALSNRLLIRGEAGSGKTTLLQYAAVRAATGSFEDTLAFLNEHVPFFIRLRQLANRELPRPEEFPGLIAPTIASTMPPGWVHGVLTTGRALVMIDGVDELVEEKRQGVRTWVTELVTEFPHCRYIITSRPVLRDAWLANDGFSEAELLSMQAEDVEAFIEHWHSAVQKGEPDAARRSELSGLSADLQSRVKADRALRELATSPLLCAMICAMHRERRQALPSNRITLYQAALAMLLHRRDVERKLVLSDLPTIEFEEKEVLLQDLAVWLLENGWASVDESRASEKIGSMLTAFPRLPAGLTGTLVLKVLMQRSGVLRSPVEGMVEFIHKTFQEFLCAKAIVRADRLLFLVEQIRSDRWREVAVLAAGLANDVRREEFLTRLLDLGDKSRSTRTVYYLLAVACLESSIRLSPDLRSSITDRIRKIHPPVTKSEARVLSTAGDLSIPLLKRFSGQRAQCAAACVRALRLIGSDDALEVLEQYGADKRSTVIQEIVGAWQAFDRERFAQRVLSQTPGV